MEIEKEDCMKKFFSFIFIVALIAAAIYGYYFFTDGAFEQRLESLSPKEIPTTQLQTSKKQDNQNAKTIGSQLYDSLTKDEKNVYDTVYEALSSYKSSVFIYENIETERIFELVRLVISCHPEIFWSKGDCTYSSNGNLSFDYPYTRQEAEEKNALIEKKAKEVIERINSSADEYELSLEIFDYIAENTSYNYSASENVNAYFESSTIEGVFLNGKAICSGYSRAYQYLLSLVGIDSIMITGNAQTPTGDGAHAWVAQQVDKEIYFTDPTWGDSYENSTDNDFISHVYFLTTTDDLEKTHKCDDIYTDIKSTSNHNFYFSLQGNYFEEYSQSAIKDSIKNSIKKDETGIELKFATDEEYKKAQENLFDKQNIYDILKSIDLFSKKIDTSNITYSVNDTQNVITILYKFN